MTSSSEASEPFQQMPMRVLPCVRLTASERAQLLQWVRRRTSPHRVVVRSRIVLLAGEGLRVSAIARHLHVTPATVRMWCHRFARAGVVSLTHDAQGRGRKAGMARAGTLPVLRAMLTARANDEEPSARSLAKQSGASASTVWRVWKQYGLCASSPVTAVEKAIEQAIAETRPVTK